VSVVGCCKDFVTNEEGKKNPMDKRNSGDAGMASLETGFCEVEKNPPCIFQTSPLCSTGCGKPEEKGTNKGGVERARTRISMVGLVWAVQITVFSLVDGIVMHSYPIPAILGPWEHSVHATLVNFFFFFLFFFLSG
jgi:hypothetical protein